jgi:tripartite-type tricarboxylate transporter receptor subunit TctC
VTSDKRLAELPDVPTVKELGIKGLENFSYATCTGLFGSAKMPPDVLKKLNDAMMKVVGNPAIVKRFADLSADAQPSTPEALAAVLDREDKDVVPLIRKLGIKAE